MNIHKALMMLAIATALTACSAADSTETTDAKNFAELQPEILQVTFENNDDANPGTCNPNVSYFIKSDREALRLNVSYMLDGAKVMGNGFALLPILGEDEVIGSEDLLTHFDAFPKPCAETDVSVFEFSCRNSAADSEDIACPELAFEGTDMFLSFKEPNW